MYQLHIILSSGGKPNFQILPRGDKKEKLVAASHLVGDVECIAVMWRSQLSAHQKNQSRSLRVGK